MSDEVHNCACAQTDYKNIKFELLAVIIDRNKVKKFSEIMKEKQIPFHFIVFAQGTVSTDILDLLGFGSVDKALVFCLGPHSKISELISHLSTKLNLKGAGNGIAFTIPLSSINNHIIQRICAETLEKLLIKEEDDYMNTNIKYDLLVSIINHGFSEDLVAAAKQAGATGGTVVNVRRISSEDAANFLGVTLQSEKEIVAILVAREKKQEIMKAICQSCGMKTEAKGWVFSLPVSSIAGLEL